MKQSLKHFKMKYFRSLPLVGDAGHPTDTASARCVIGVTVGEAGTPATGRSSEGRDFRFSALPPPGRGRPLDVRAITVEVYMRATPAHAQFYVANRLVAAVDRRELRSWLRQGPTVFRSPPLILRRAGDVAYFQLEGHTAVMLLPSHAISKLRQILRD